MGHGTEKVKRAKDKSASNSIGGGLQSVVCQITCSSPTCFGPSEFYSLKQPSLSSHYKIVYP